jgi:plastocyanin
MKGSPMRRLLIVIVVVIVTVALAATVALSASASPTTVATRGDEKFVPNAMVQSTLRFSPGMVNASTGQILTWTHDDMTEAPHTVTIVDQADLPTTLEEVFECPACLAALDAHLSGGLNPVVDVGAPGLDQPGDSLLFFHGESISAEVSAPAGTTLYYLCALHPWMQGSITVG